MISTDAFFDELTKIGAFSDSIVRKAISGASTGRVEEMLTKNQRTLGSLARKGKASPNRERFNTMLSQSSWLRGVKPAAPAASQSRGFLRSQNTPSYGVGA